MSDWKEQAQRRITTSESSPDGPLLTVIIPVLDEAATVGTLLQRVFAAPYEKEIIVVDGGSTDGTRDVLKNLQSEHRLHVMLRTGRLGKGAAIREALPLASGRITIIQDADLEYDPSEYDRLIEPIRQGITNIVFGSRFLHQRWYTFSSFRVGSSLLNLIVRCIYRIKLTDEATCYKAMPTELLRNMHLQCTGFEFCPEVTAKAVRLGERILEVSISYRGRTRAEGKKIRWRDGIAAAKMLWRLRNWTPPGKQSDHRKWARSGFLASPSDARGGARAHRRQGGMNRDHRRPHGHDEALYWAEAACWYGLALAPLLYWANGPAVSSEQGTIRTVLLILAAAGGCVLTCYRRTIGRRKQ